MWNNKNCILIVIRQTSKTKKIRFVVRRDLFATKMKMHKVNMVFSSLL